MTRSACVTARCVLPLLALAATSAASPAYAAPADLPARVHLSFAPCASMPFDVEAHLAALRVELVALGVEVALAASPEPLPELSLSSPDCDDRLVLRLRHHARTNDSEVQASELPVLGRERALALVVIERLQRAWPALTAEPSTTAAQPALARTPPLERSSSPASARTASTLRGGRDDHALGQGALCAGLRFSAAAPLASLGLTVDRSLSRKLALGGALGWRTEREDLADATDAHSMTIGPRLELSLFELGSVELTTAVGLAAGVGWIVTDRAGASDARISSSPAPLGLLTGMLGLRAALPWRLFLQTGVVADYALLGAHFETPGGRRLAELTGARFAAFVGAGARLGG